MGHVDCGPPAVLFITSRVPVLRTVNVDAV